MISFDKIAKYLILHVEKFVFDAHAAHGDAVAVSEPPALACRNVNILYDNGESYVVELDKSSTDNLWPGDEIIVNAKNLYDGKVVTES